ncbi:hypothetical protein K3172_04080 [Qipengyuania sp. 6B39]|uniref:hypothetical protein n=1 Tax=Qipengyuania proteolytica TaxID=2867239 RepID=UPI001C8A98FB|nr:hypothetical protein [Qipengyuania proteolytica]MBX7495034.1 hypothetical protein [Qipengyuania proteolytica]
MQFPNQVQSALLLDGPPDDLDSVVRNFITIMEAKEGFRFNVPESTPGVFYRLFGGDSMTVSFELVPNPGNSEVFSQPLGSAITGIMCPDVRERVMRHQAMVLVTVTHGVLGSVGEDPKIAAMLRDIGMPREGGNLPQFLKRLEVCQLASRVACEAREPLLVHWTQSNQIFPGELFDDLAALPAPSPLHVHPYLFGPRSAQGEKQTFGIRSFGAQHFIGGEIVVEPHELPFGANFEVMLSFIRIAIAQNGYIIPDGDTFGPEDRSLSYRCTHRQPDEGGVPLYELTPLFHREYGYQSTEFAPYENRIDDRMPPPGLMPESQEAKAALANEWREKRSMAEGIGGRFEVRTFETPPPQPRPPAGPPPVTGPGPRRAMFGRKGL